MNSAKSFLTKRTGKSRNTGSPDRWEEAIGIGHNHPPKDEEYEKE